ncbi:MAG TPA: HAMP domain-containing sensor histidine kinase [Acidimicrobiales bacterium]|nr:HAMP domain-containing sensor histidine kinase [Acidimicrobiales bacterium]
MAAVSAVATLPFVGVGLVALGRYAIGRPNAWSSAAAAAALVAFLAASGLLLVRWRLLGEAPSVPFATVAALVGLFIVPTIVCVPPPESSYPAALRAVSVVFVLACCAYALRLPEVHSRLRPARFMLPVLAAALILSVGLAVSPVGPLLACGLHGVFLLEAIEAGGCLLVAAALLRRGIRAGRVLFVCVGAALLSLSGACAALSDAGLGLKGPWVTLPGTFLVVGAMTRLLTAGADVKLALQRIVRNDVRGRRRWEAAESALSHARLSYQGQRHDINSVLSAVDGTLLVLTSERDRLPAKDVSRLLTAVREQVQVLRGLLSAGRAPAGHYDLSHLLGTIIATRATTEDPVLSQVEEGLQVEGRPEHLAAIVGNLLTNAATHARGTQVVLTANRRLVSGVQVVELTVSDNGPGLPAEELDHAFEGGWRGGGADTVPGSGLGLYQCRKLAEAEGGFIQLLPTDPAAPLGRQGLTVRLSIPMVRALPPEQVLTA